MEVLVIEQWSIVKPVDKRRSCRIKVAASLILLRIAELFLGAVGTLLQKPLLQLPSYFGYDPKVAREIDLQTLLINYIRILARDRRNLVIAFLSVLVVFFAFGAHPAGREVSRIQTETVPVAAVSAAQYSAVSYTPSSQVQPKFEAVVEPAVHVKSQEPVAQATAELSVVSSLSVSEEAASQDNYPDPVPAVFAVDPPVEAGMDQVEVAIEPQLLEPGKELLLLDA